MNELSFKVLGDPVGKGRPKFARRGNQVHAYTPQKTASYENQVRAALLMQCDNLSLTDKPVEMVIEIIVAIPKSWSKKKRAEAMNQPCSKKPDIDNYCKIIMDALNGWAYIDDSQVFSLSASKRYGLEPMAIVTIRS